MVWPRQHLRRWVDQYPRRFVIISALLVFAALSVIVFRAVANADHAAQRANVLIALVQHTVAVAQKAADQECDRVNLVRMQGDTTASISYIALAGEVRSSALFRSTIAPALRPAYDAQLALARNALAKLRIAGVTDCAQARTHPDTYRPPHPQLVGDAQGHISRRSQAVLQIAQAVLSSPDPTVAMRRIDHSL